MIGAVPMTNKPLTLAILDQEVVQQPLRRRQGIPCRMDLLFYYWLSDHRASSTHNSGHNPPPPYQVTTKPLME